MKKSFILFVFMILIASNVEAFHTTNEHGRYDDQHPKDHKGVIFINNHYNIHDNTIIQRESYRGTRYSSYDRYSRYNSRYRDRDYRTSRYLNYRISKYSRSKYYTKSYKSRYDNYRRSKSYRVRDSVYVY
ncbi:MAG: hypothetical protein QGF74_01800 [Candidatus Nanoarchaeia archaeon]|jgi:hypothetical protein|nr:hypothetical protein [Candidatus Nanoarchaeia archaeon]|tara:strand:+ start:72 stop:461 length:390 start_codon:yes stop_codon:yes gene_type:complete